MSTIRVDNFAPSAGGTAFGIEGIAKAFAHYNQASDITYDTGNVSSITDVGTGDFDINLTNSHSLTQFTTPATNENGSGGGRISGADSSSASQIRVVTRNLSAALADAARASISAFGDLA